MNYTISAMIALTLSDEVQSIKTCNEGLLSMEATTTHPAGRTSNKSTDLAMKRLLMVLLIVLSVLGIAAILLKVFLVHPASHDIKSKEYQALFLTNGQVYFGKLTHLDNNYVELTDIYYLQTQAAQPTTGSTSSTTTQSQSLSLAKLGNELHGPEDAMFVAKSQVLFWENLKDSGKVVQAIQSYQATKK